MYAILSSRYALRGWHGLPFGLRDRVSGHNAPLDAESFRALSLCDGKTPILFPLFSAPLINRVTRLIREGIAQVCEPGATLREDQAYRRTESRFIDLVQWSITGKCNLRCRHCYLEAPNAKYGELSTEQCLEIVDQLHEANVGRIAITGGEPLVRPDFWRIVDALQSRDIRLAQIYTNGVLLDDRTLAEFQSRGLQPTLILSFDGVGAHDWLRGSAGAEDKARDAIARSVAAGFPVSVETAAHKGNLSRLIPTYAVLKGLGIRGWKVSAMMNTGGWTRERGQMDAPRTALFDTYLDLAMRHRRDGAPFELALGGVYHGLKDHALWRSPFRRFSGKSNTLARTVCHSCRIHPYVAADGGLLPCLPMTGTSAGHEMPKLTDTTLSRAMRDSVYFERIDTRVKQLFAENRMCRACAHRLKCGGGCRATALSAGVGYFGADPDACFFFKNGYDEKLQRKLKSKPVSLEEMARARSDISPSIAATQSRIT